MDSSALERENHAQPPRIAALTITQRMRKELYCMTPSYDTGASIGCRFNANPATVEEDRGARLRTAAQAAFCVLRGALQRRAAPAVRSSRAPVWHSTTTLRAAARCGPAGVSRLYRVRFEIVL